MESHSLESTTVAKPRKRRDPMESMIESTLELGNFIGWLDGSDFVADLRRCEGEIAKLTARQPKRASKPPDRWQNPYESYESSISSAFALHAARKVS
jgi:hypothetical protein